MVKRLSSFLCSLNKYLEVFHYFFLPGEVIEQNASRVLSDGSLQWDLPVGTSVVDVRAVSDAGASSFPWWLIAVAGGALVLIVVALIVANRRRNTSVQAIQQAQAEAIDDEAAGE